ncbi:ferredoxin [Streptomyces hygroscopicus subsp. hygroscopicus]|uniref:ferredoxin n=1 Tax=Streptomyces hygroscopicus TaxID=1912 RepID=UPI0007DB63B9|nr:MULTISPECIES: ferredoxin [Streptomyces]MBW8089350.1 ferredoxin [Streptomyces hygroscopicus subsp. hygroscopicus]
MRVTVDQPRCVASGQCVFAAPDIFDQDDEGTVVVLEAAPSPDRRADVEEAATLCPAAAILLE